ncbi:MAG: succinate dehydrogenase, hydrophobic membrane anchor protein [Novosphingobium sp.]|jgi:succinate dehydrogenase / fumarate reductase membrane anchor subunit|uniref:succinate dehydrogenase, hydrophobic membrane anchor protein n=1 Tax=Novosphingobium sp. TaxID=1874826 RepID=UPI00391A8070|nr:succinate dehydrogenase, hydrophobic membrane anchor protein [Novosphingobium sp.]
MGNGTNIGRVRGLGSAKSGTHHWMLQRFTAVGNLVLGLWLLFSLVGLPDLGFKTVMTWAAQPISATALVLFVVTTFWHARLGLQVLIEDYVHEHANKFAVMTLLNLASFGGAAFGVFAIVRIALGAAA